MKQSVVVYAGPKILEPMEAIPAVVGKDVKLAASVDLGWILVPRPADAHAAQGLLRLARQLGPRHHPAHHHRQARDALLDEQVDEVHEGDEQAQAGDGQDQDAVQGRQAAAEHGDDESLQADQINPFGGCLPMLLQMPIWITLYQMLRSASELYRAPFFGWIHDLTAPDPLHTIPVVLTAIMFLQARISPQAVDSQQQKMMQYIMPVMFGFMSLVFPAGLAIYMFTNTLLSMTHQLWMNKNMDKPKAKTATVPSSVIEVTATTTSSSPSPSPSGGGGKKKGSGGKNKMVKA